MPEMDGWEVTQRLRQESKFAELPIIIVSASTLPADKSYSYQAGANQFLAKPLSFHSLLLSMEQHLKLEWVDIQGKKQFLNSPSRSHISTESLLFSTIDSNSAINKYPLPSPTELDRLLTLAMQGDIRSILSQAEQLKQNNPQLTLFIQEVTHLAENCQIRKLKQFVKQALRLFH